MELHQCHLLGYREVMAYEVHTEVYDGPFDLLLHLILQDQVDIYEVSLTRIVDAYLAELDKIVERVKEEREASGQIDLEMATEFLLIAATLVELKTRRLLPATNDLDLDEELGIWEERDLLLARLVECKTFKNAAEVLRQLSTVASLSYARRAGPDERFFALAPDLLEGIGAEDLKTAFIRALTPKPRQSVDLHHVAPITASVTDAMIEMIDELPRAGTMSFRGLTEGFVDRIEIVVRFLAVLELFKQGYLELEQDDHFGDISIRWIGEQDDLLVSVKADGYDG